MKRDALTGLLFLVLSTTAQAEYYNCNRLVDIEDCSEGCDATIIDEPYVHNKYQYVTVNVMTSATSSVKCFLVTTPKPLYSKDEEVVVTAKPYDRDNSNVTIIDIRKIVDSNKQNKTKGLNYE